MPGPESIDVATVNQLIRQVIRTVLAMPDNSVRPANQDAPTGDITQQFATVLITVISRQGWDDVILGVNQLYNDGPFGSSDYGDADDQTVTEGITGQRTVSASIQFFRGDAYAKASRLPALLHLSNSVDLMDSLGIGIIHVGEPKNLTAVVDTLVEERGQIDIDFCCVLQEINTLNTYLTFPTSVVIDSDF